MKKAKGNDTEITLKDVFSVEGLKVAGLAAIPAASLSLLAYVSFHAIANGLGNTEIGMNPQQQCEQTFKEYFERMRDVTTFSPAEIKKFCPPEMEPAPPWIVF